jgi:hypothetical protein
MSTLMLDTMVHTITYAAFICSFQPKSGVIYAARLQRVKAGKVSYDFPTHSTLASLVRYSGGSSSRKTPPGAGEVVGGLTLVLPQSISCSYVRCNFARPVGTSQQIFNSFGKEPFKAMNTQLLRPN